MCTYTFKALLNQGSLAIQKFHEEMRKELGIFSQGKRKPTEAYTSSE